MSCINYLTAADVKNYLPETITLDAGKLNKPRVPVFSSKTVEIFAKIQPNFPDSTKPLNSIKTLDKSVTEIKFTLDKLNESNKCSKALRILSKVGSLVALAALVMLAIGGIVGFCFLGPLGIVPAAVFLTMVGFGIFSTSCWIKHAFCDDQKNGNKLSSLKAEAKINHELLKEYIIENYEVLRSKINESLESNKADLQKLKDLKSPLTKEEQRLENEISGMTTALKQLDILQKFYQDQKETTDQ